MNGGLYLCNENDYILVAGDSPVQDKRLQFFFDKHNIKSNFCLNGEQALKQAIKEKPALIENLLDFSRSKKVDFTPEEVNLSELAAEVAENLQESSYSGNYDIRIQEGMTVNADPGLMKVVLHNLLGNAFKYSQKAETPEILIAKGHEKGKDFFYVQDNSVGFDMNKAGNLLKPFTRLHSGKDYSGSGVGLSTVNRIIERHGGKVWFESEPGKGSTFYFSLV